MSDVSTVRILVVDQGPQGPQGPATVAVGGTTTGAPGSSAAVVNSGTAEDVVLDFTIPEGQPGDQGIHWEGVWSSETTYGVRDAVRHQAAGEDQPSSYISLQDGNTGNEPPAPGDAPDAWWDVLAGGGLDGEGAPASNLSPEVTAAAQAGAVGEATTYARRDHEHPSEAFAALSGATFTGDVVLAGDPDAPLEAATKQYVDGRDTFAIQSSSETEQDLGTVGGATELVIDFSLAQTNVLKAEADDDVTISYANLPSAGTVVNRTILVEESDGPHQYTFPVGTFGVPDELEAPFEIVVTARGPRVAVFVADQGQEASV